MLEVTYREPDQEAARELRQHLLELLHNTVEEWRAPLLTRYSRLGIGLIARGRMSGRGGTQRER